MKEEPMDKRERRQRREMRLYQVLGVKVFQKAVFALERRRHRKDGGRNTNYHIRHISVSGISDHFAYLYYNAAIHVADLAFVVIAAIAVRLLHLETGLWNGAVMVLIVLNFYCLMLQRYNALRMRRILSRCRSEQRKRAEKKAHRLAGMWPEKFSAEQADAALHCMTRIKDAVDGKRDCILQDEDALLLETLAKWAEIAGCAGENCPVTCGKAEASGKDPRLYTKADAGADRLVRRVRPMSGGLLTPYAVITRGRPCEMAFRRLFPAATADGMRETADMFIILFEMGPQNCGSVGLPESER